MKPGSGMAVSPKEPDPWRGTEPKCESAFHIVFLTECHSFPGIGGKDADIGHKIQFYDSAFRYLRTDSFTVNSTPLNRRKPGNGS
jgi:hypothetical protein